MAAREIFKDHGEFEYLKMGLTSAEAERRFKADGGNEIDGQNKFNGLKLFVSQFKSPLIYILIIAGVITLWLGEYIDSGVIWAAVVVNSVLGFWQEFKAAKALEALRGYLNPKAKVIRDGERKIISLGEVVRGDVCILEQGKSVPADGVVIEAKSLSINEAMLTGESMPVNKRQIANSKWQTRQFEKLSEKYRVFMGTMVQSGRGLMVVKRVGSNTQMGKIASKMESTIEAETPLQERLRKLSKTLAIIVFGAAVIIFGLGLLRNHGAVEMFETAVAVAVAAIPEGLVVGLTVILALGMQRILKRKAVVRKLVAAETLGSVSVICADKTGTLTEGKMKVVELVTEGKAEKEMLKKAMRLSNDQEDPLETAEMEWLNKQVKLGEMEGWEKRFVSLDEIPFSPERKMAVSLHKNVGERKLMFVRGAPEVVLEKCQITNAKLKIWREKMDSLGEKGYRMIAFAYKERGGGNKLSLGQVDRLYWLGLVVFDDPVRESVGAALKQARQAGIKVKIITGDYKSTAVAIIGKLHIANSKLQMDEIMDGEELERCSMAELERRVGKIKLFVRTTPQQKLKIVEALQTNNEVVAMTGDGVNDALALKKADIGVVVNEASDVSKEIADMVLLDNNFKTIVEAVREGRVIYETLRKIIVYLLSSSFTELILVGVSLIMGLPLPITAVQILWVNLAEDSLPNLALAFERESEDVMKQGPRARGGSILDGEMKVLIFLIGIATDLILLALFLILYRQGMGLEEIRSFVFVALGIDSLLYVFSVKTLNRNIWHENLVDNKFLLAAVGIGFGLLISAVYWPPLQKILGTQALVMWEWGLLLGLGFIEVGAVEGVKFVFLRKQNH